MPRNRTSAGVCVLAGAVVLSMAAAIASPAAAIDRCVVGQRVVKPGGKLATVTATSGSGCTVRADGESFTDVYSAFMLDAAPGAAAAGAPARPAATARPAPASRQAGGAAAVGRYECTGGAAAGNLDLRILGGGRYANAQGKAGVYSVDAGTGRMSFTSGPWAGFYGAVLAGGRIGLTSKPTGSFYQMTCDRRG